MTAMMIEADQVRPEERHAAFPERLGFLLRPSKA